MEALALITVFSPLMGFLLAGTCGQILQDRFSQIVTCLLMFASTCCAAYLFFNMALSEKTLTFDLFPWIKVEFFQVSWGLQLDSLSLVMMGVVTIVSLMVHIYSVGYMKDDPGIARFMSYLSLFTFFMLSLVTAPNLLQMFFGWEGVGLCSYLLIGFWYNRESANEAAIKAFLVNRIGDMAFVLGIITIFVMCGTVDFDTFLGSIDDQRTDVFSFLGFNIHGITLASFLLFIGAMGKSAQIGFHTWLPDAMEGPTPVSALIHAATMVTAGVFMVVRISPLLEYAPLAREFIIIVGVLTAFVTATIACVQNDIKRIIAYSTCSQLGYMFMAAGVSGYSASMFHLTTHAFFKALLFLGAGSVIHAMSDEQDIQKMGGVWKYIPVTYAVMWVGTLALIGFPFFAGFYSKDIILEVDWVSSLSAAKFAYYVGLLVAVMTAFYSIRLLILAFHGKPRADEAVMNHIHESPFVMLFPLVVLALGAIFSGYALDLLFVGGETTFWGNAIFVLPQDEVISLAHHVSPWVHWAPTVMAFLGAGIAYICYERMKAIPSILLERLKYIYLFIYHKWYFDELYDRLFVYPSLKLGKYLWEEGDQEIIDGLGPDGVSAVAYAGGGLLSRLQTGYIYHYAFGMILGLVLLIGWYYWL